MLCCFSVSLGVNMAAKETVNSYQVRIESVVNGWLVDYYFFLAVEFFKNEQYEDFCAIIDILDCIMARPLESTDDIAMKFRVLQFISRINEGENLGVSFEMDVPSTPLESALMLLEKISQEFSIPQQEYEKVSTSLKDMIVGIFIKNSKFEKAEEVLMKHFPPKNIGKRAIFMGLIRKKKKIHDVIEQINFQQFKEEMIGFCLRICHFSLPLLHKAAKHLIDKTLVDQESTATESDEQAEPRPCSSSQIATVQFVPCTHSLIHKTRLEAAYKSLATGLNKRTFAQLEEEVDREELERENLCEQLSMTSERCNSLDLEERLFQRDSGGPMEASPADQPPRELEPEVRRKKAPQRLSASNEKDRQCRGADKKGATPTRKSRIQANRTHTRNQDGMDVSRTTASSVESSPSQSPSQPVRQTTSTPHKDSGQNKSARLLKWNQLYHDAKESKGDKESYVTPNKSSSDMSTISNSGQRKRKWTESETQKLKDGVKKFGEGNWCKIKEYYGFKDRTNVNLKDRWRTMKKSNII
ncbi:telomeric repeat-binding factor 2 isoform X2 [Oreochromis aureus]|uniref:telomeric repeat-binding factor 2 isoform X2 n=1 Tax=Oreochromis aureus TaxID=47969 RepID=UPI001953C7EA|nr:telomeric repeat-binding factor 2 isoform X2 [Oreochromis aureus]